MLSFSEFETLYCVNQHLGELACPAQVILGVGDRFSQAVLGHGRGSQLRICGAWRIMPHSSSSVGS